MEKEEPQTAVQLGGSHKPMGSPKMKTAVEESCTEQGGPGSGPLGRLVMERSMARAWRLRWVLKGQQLEVVCHCRLGSGEIEAGTPMTATVV